MLPCLVDSTMWATVKKIWTLDSMVTLKKVFSCLAPEHRYPWIQYPDYDWTAGSLQRSGCLQITKLREGQYAFAKEMCLWTSKSGKA